MMKQVPYRVLLPGWIREKARDKEEFKRLVLEYMKRYPDYRVKKVVGEFAICEHKEPRG